MTIRLLSFMGFKTRSSKMCNKRTYINSFFTTGGAEILSSTVNIRTTDIDFATSDCVYEKSDGGFATSMTMGCNEKVKFTYSSFGGKNCEGFNFVVFKRCFVNHQICIEGGLGKLHGRTDDSRHFITTA